MGVREIREMSGESGGHREGVKRMKQEGVYLEGEQDIETSCN